RLEAKHAGTWLDGYADVAKVRPRNFSKVEVDANANAVFERGMLRRIAMEPEHVAAAWEWAAAREPIAGIELLVGEGISVYDMPCAERFRTLAVHTEGWFTSHSVGRVLAWGMPQLRDLDLSGCDLGVGGCHLLANLAT